MSELGSQIVVTLLISALAVLTLLCLVLIVSLVRVSRNLKHIGDNSRHTRDNVEAISGMVRGLTPLGLVARKVGGRAVRVGRKAWKKRKAAR